MKRNARFYAFVCIFTIALLGFHQFMQTCSAPIGVSFALSVEPSSLTIPLGGSGQSIVNVSARGNPGLLPVDLSASVMSEVSTSFDPAQVTIQPGEDWHHNQSTLTIAVSHAATPGVYALTVFADFGITILNTSITLTISTDEHDSLTVGGYVTDFRTCETIPSDSVCTPPSEASRYPDNES